MRDRLQAGQLLGEALLALRLRKPVVLGIPRGGLITAREVASVLGGELDIVLARKLRAPYNPELAIGAITESGKVFLDETLVSSLDISPEYLDQEKRYQLAEIGRRLKLIREVLPKTPLSGRLVVVTDDGVATGSTMQAALWAARHEKPEKLVCALPVGPEETIERLSKACDELVLLRLPPSFAAVGQFYLRFEQVEDEEVLEILREEAKRQSS